MLASVPVAAVAKAVRTAVAAARVRAFVRVVPAVAITHHNAVLGCIVEQQTRPARVVQAAQPRDPLGHLSNVVKGDCQLLVLPVAHVNGRRVVAPVPLACLGPRGGHGIVHVAQLLGGGL